MSVTSGDTPGLQVPFDSPGDEPEVLTNLLEGLPVSVEPHHFCHLGWRWGVPAALHCNTSSPQASGDCLAADAVLGPKLVDRPASVVAGNQVIQLG